MSETPFLIREAPSIASNLMPLTPQVAHPLVVLPSPDATKAFRANCDGALAALDTYASAADYRGKDNGTFKAQVAHYSSRVVWSLSALVGAAAGYLTQDIGVAGWAAAVTGALGAGAAAALPAARERLAAGKPIAPEAVDGLTSLDPDIAASLARTVIADMTNREIFGNQARAKLDAIATKGNPETGAAADRLVSFALTLPSRFTKMTTVDDDQATAILMAYQALTPEEQVVGRQLVRDKLIATKAGPDMMPGVWQVLYDLTRPPSVTPDTRSTSSLCEGSIAALRTIDRTAFKLTERVAYLGDKVDGAAMKATMCTATMTVGFSAPMVGVVADSFLAGAYTAVVAIRLAVGMFRHLEAGDDAELRLGAAEDAFDSTLAHFDTSTPEGRAIAAELAQRIERRLDGADVRGAGLRDKLKPFIDDPRVSDDDRAGAARLIEVLELLGRPMKHASDADAVLLLHAFAQLTPREQEIVGPFATQKLFQLKKQPKGLSYERFQELQTAFGRRPLLLA